MFLAGGSPTQECGITALLRPHPYHGQQFENGGVRIDGVWSFEHLAQPFPGLRHRLLKPVVILVVANPKRVACPVVNSASAHRLRNGFPLKQQVRVKFEGRYQARLFAFVQLVALYRCRLRCGHGGRDRVSRMA